MKKIILIAGLLFCSQTIFAQLEKGMVAVGLTSGFTVAKTENEGNIPSAFTNSNYTTKTTTYNLTPTASYFLTDRFAIGLSVGYVGYKTISDNIDNDLGAATQKTVHSETTSHGTSISPYVKYYFPITEHFNFFIRGGVYSTFSAGKTSGYTDDVTFDGSGNVTSSIRSGEYGPNKTKTVDLGFGLSPGVLFMPGKKVGLEFSLGNVVAYNSRTAKTTYNNSSSTDKSTTSGLQFFDFNTISIGTGIYYFF